MAKRRVVLTEQEKEVFEQFGKDCIDILNASADEGYFEVEGAPKLTVKYGKARDDSGRMFGHAVLLPGLTFRVSYAYVGSSGKLIFGLEPEDPQEYEFVEIDAKQADTYFPLVGPALGEAFAKRQECFAGIEKLPEVVEAVVTYRINTQKSAEEAAKQNAMEIAKDNPLFGLF